jgi:hypothetical protein
MLFDVVSHVKPCAWSRGVHDCRFEHDFPKLSDLRFSGQSLAHGRHNLSPRVYPLAQTLKVKKETEPVRNLILGIAFSKTGLQKDE